jgi:alcohol dehydrogenase class IV
LISPFNIARLPQILFGEGRLSDVPMLLAAYGRRTLVVAGSRTFIDSPHWGRLSAAMAETGICWDVLRVDGEPSPEIVDQAVGQYPRASKVDVVLGIGGGSAIDAAKAIAGLLPFGNSVMDHLEGVGRGVPYEGPAGAARCCPNYGRHRQRSHEKRCFERAWRERWIQKIFSPRLSCAGCRTVVDPQLTYSCPPDLTAATGMDALTQLIESYTSTGSNAFTDALALSGLTAASEWDCLTSAWSGEPEGRSAMSYAALLSGITLAHAGLGVVHGLSIPARRSSIPCHMGSPALPILAPAISANISALKDREPNSPYLMKYTRIGQLLSGSADVEPEVRVG